MAANAPPVEIAAALGKAALFAGLSEAQLASIAPLTRGVSFGSGAVIFREGDPARFLYVVVRGRVTLEMTIEGGNRLEPVVVGVMGDGDAVGLSALTHPYVLHLTAVAKGACQAVEIDAEALREAIDLDHTLGLRIMTNAGVLLSSRLTLTRRALIREGAGRGEG